MAIVTALQFNTNSGAMICDEEYWYLRRRRAYFLDNVRSLIPAEIAEALGMEAAYGGWGHPGFHEEVIMRTRRAIEKHFNDGSGEKPETYPLNDLEGIAMLVRESMQETRRRKINDMLTYLYGFTIDDVNRGFWEENGQRYDIKQEMILKEAKAIISYEKKGHLTDPIFKNKAVVIGYDPKFHFRGFHINGENTVCSLISGGFEAIGAGLYGAGIEFSSILNRMTLDQRHRGFDPVWGMIALFRATLNAYDHFHEVGGGLNLIYIDGSKRSHKERFTEMSDARTHLAMEIVKALHYSLISLENAYILTEDILFKHRSVKEVESHFFSAATNQVLLKKLLRGYKIPPFPEEAIVTGAKAQSSTKKVRKSS